MARTLASIFAEADSIIEKRASAAPSATPPDSDDDIFKLAEMVRSERETVSAALTEMEKAAHSMAVLETLLSAPQLKALVEVEKTARARGFSDEAIQAFYEKFASKADVGRKVSNFFTGMGSSLEEAVKAVPTFSKDTATAAGQIAGIAAPLVGVGALGGAIGSKMKENQIKKQLGMP